jgi:hypothetical protein
MFLNTVLSVKSLCSLDLVNLFEKKSNVELAKPKFPSEF